MAEENDILEEGAVYFFYRPAVEEEHPHGLADVQRFYLVLSPDGGGFRLLVIGRKRLPDPEEHERHWGFVEAVVDDADELKDFLGADTYETKTRGRRKQPAARPAGEGRYAIVSDGYNTRLAYARKLPEKRNKVQAEFEIEDEASYVLSVKNPEVGSPSYAGLSKDRTADFPKHLRERFEGRRWIGADPTDLLDYEGAEILLIGAQENVPDVTRDDLQPGRTRKTSEILRKLHIRKSEVPVRPLFEGEWD